MSFSFYYLISSCYLISLFCKFSSFSSSKLMEDVKLQSKSFTIWLFTERQNVEFLILRACFLHLMPITALWWRFSIIFSLLLYVRGLCSIQNLILLAILLQADILLRGYYGWNSPRAIEVLDHVFPKVLVSKFRFKGYFSFQSVWY